MFDVCGRRSARRRSRRRRANRRRFAVRNGREVRACAGRACCSACHKFECTTHADGKRDGFRAGPHAGLLEAAEELWLQLDAVSHD